MLTAADTEIKDDNKGCGSRAKLQGWEELWEGNAHKNQRAPMGPVKFP